MVEQVLDAVNSQDQFWQRPRFQRFAGNALQDLGVGLATGTSFGRGLGIAAQRTAALSGDRNAYEAQLREQQAEQEQETRTMEWVRQNAPQFLGAIEAGVTSPADAWAQMNAGRGNVPTSIQEFEYGQEHPDFAASQTQSNRFGTSIVTGRDAQGNLVPMQVSQSGGLVQAELPSGVEYDPGALNFERAEGTASGKLSTEAANQTYQTQQNATQTIGLIDSMIGNEALGIPEHPGLMETFGTFGVVPQQMLPAIPGTQKADFGARLSQMEGRAFLEAFESLKGGGQITEIEGRKATEAMARLGRDQSADAFREALKEVRALAELVRERAARGAYIGTDGRVVYPASSTPAAQTTSTGVSWSIE